MADGACRERWEHTSSLLASVHNVMSSKPRKPSELNPYSRLDRATAKPHKVGVDVLISLWARKA